MYAPYWLGIQSAGMLVYGLLMVTVLAYLSFTYRWPNWVVDCLIDAIMVPYFIVAAIISFRIVEPHSSAIFFFIADGCLAVMFAWCASVACWSSERFRWRAPRAVPDSRRHAHGVDDADARRGVPAVAALHEPASVSDPRGNRNRLHRRDSVDGRR